MPKGERILEIGAGSGWQAKILTGHGFEVDALDVSGSEHKKNQVWSVKEYDGENIPAPADHFGVIFSSNVLEHIPHIQSFLRELLRVSKPGGLAIYILPSVAWRIYTSLAHYPFLLKAFFLNFGPDKSHQYNKAAETFSQTPPLQKVGKVLASSRHGVRGNIITETYYFSKMYWSNLFQSTGWIIENQFSNKLFYTGYGILDSKLNIPTRHILSLFLGSSCHIFVLRKKVASPLN
jgi:2-polyprenyl-3-methyl-5-hydroxy-6-metoxy-1,4-benzoquinol methylase